MKKSLFISTFFILFFILFSMNAVSAFSFVRTNNLGASDLGTFRQGNNVTLFQSCPSCPSVTLKIGRAHV